MGKAIEITDANMAEIINSGQTVLIDFWAEWCGPCKMMTPVVEELASEFEGKAVIGKLDVDSNPAATTQFGIRSIPTLMIFKDGQMLERKTGVQSKATLLAELNKQVA